MVHHDQKFLPCNMKNIYILAILISRQTNPQTSGLSKLHTTDFTLEWFDAIVLHHMEIEITLLGVSGSAYVAFVWLLTRMNPHMILQIGFTGQHCSTKLKNDNATLQAPQQTSNTRQPFLPKSRYYYFLNSDLETGLIILNNTFSSPVHSINST